MNPRLVFQQIIYVQIVRFFLFVCLSFAVNIGPNDKDVALHVNPRFNRFGDINKVVCNSYQWGSWGAEVREGSFPFYRGTQFRVSCTIVAMCLVVSLCYYLSSIVYWLLIPSLSIQIVIYLTPAQFVVTLPDGYNIQFPNRLRGEHYTFVSVDGDVHITSFEIK